MASFFSRSSDLQARVRQLERQVTGLMSTVTLLHKKMYLQNMGIPPPDQFVQVEATQKVNAKSSAQQGSLDAIASSSPKTKDTSEAPPKIEKDLTTLEPFQYSPLNAKASEIRLISILKSKTPDEPIECEVSIKSLPESLTHRDRPRFMPLSYTWGGLEKTKTIALNGRAFRVTKNLYVALKHFRNVDPASISPYGHAYASKYASGQAGLSFNHWWVDAICINQDDLDERSSQVALMTRLYRMALVAHVWLGEEAGDSSRAMELIRKLSRKATDQEQRDFVNRKPGQTHIYNGPGIVPEKLPDEPPSLSNDEKNRNYDALVNLFKRDWFSRVWILQEVALPGSVMIHCGDQVCQWSELMRTTSLLVYLADEHRLPNLQRSTLFRKDSIASNFERAEQLVRLRQVMRSTLGSKNPYLSLSNALLFAKNSSATDQRDKVFAILPLISPESTRLAANYRQPIVEVYKATALDLAAKSLDFFSACQYQPGISSDLPSWAPDFSRTLKYYPMLMTLVPTNSVDEPVKELAVYKPEDNILKVRGVILDTLSIIKDCFITAESSAKDVRIAKTEWESFVREKDRDGSLKSKNLDDLRYHSSGNGMYWPLFQVSYIGDKGEQCDLSIRTFNQSLTVASDDLELDREARLGWYRNFFVGRRFTLTEQRHAGVVPAAAQPGDKVCKFQGSELTFILRQSSPGRWIIIGDGHFLGNFSPYEIEHMRPPLPIQDFNIV